MSDKQNPKPYRVHATLTALKFASDGHSRFVTIPRGSVIAIPGTRKELSLVEVVWEGEALSVFNRDIEEHTEEI